MLAAMSDEPFYSPTYLPKPYTAALSGERHDRQTDLDVDGSRRPGSRDRVFRDSHQPLSGFRDRSGTSSGLPNLTARHRWTRSTSNRPEGGVVRLVSGRR